MTYEVRIYLNGLHWDDSYVDSLDEAKAIKAHAEDASESIWDRLNHESVQAFLDRFHYAHPESIKVVAEILDADGHHVS